MPSPIVRGLPAFPWPCTIVGQRNARQYGIKYVSALYLCRVAQMSNGRQRRCPVPLRSTAAGEWLRAPDGAGTAKLYITMSFGHANYYLGPGH
jgi:hypothetical protein